MCSRMIQCQRECARRSALSLFGEIYFMAFFLIQSFHRRTKWEGKSINTHFYDIKLGINLPFWIRCRFWWCCLLSPIDWVLLVTFLWIYLQVLHVCFVVVQYFDSLNRWLLLWMSLIWVYFCYTENQIHYEEQLILL